MIRSATSRTCAFGGVHDDQRELVPAEPGDGVGAAADRPQPPGDLDQQLVADGVPEAVVDRLEPVEVEHEHGGQVPAASGAGDGLVDALGQQRAVGEIGQRVVEGEALQLPVRVRELAGALGHPSLEVPVERLQLLGQHVDADDHRVDVVRGRRGPHADREFAGGELHHQLDELFQTRIRLRRRHRHTPRGNDHFPLDGSSRKSVDGATRCDRLVGGASRSRVTTVGGVSARLTLVAHASTAATSRAAFGGDEGLEPRGAAAAAAARLRRVTRAVCSPARAAVETAAALGLAATVDAGVADWHLGGVAGPHPRRGRGRPPGRRRGLARRPGRRAARRGVPDRVAGARGGLAGADRTARDTRSPSRTRPWCAPRWS